MRPMTSLALPIAALGLTLALGGCDGKAQPKGAATEAEAPAAKAPEAKKAAAAEGPADLARRVLVAFKAKDVKALAPLLVEKHRAEFTEAAPKMFDANKPNIAAMRDWDGKTLEVRYAGSEALVHFGPADGRLAVLEFAKGADGKWYWASVRYSSAADFAAWGSTDPGAPVPACNGGGKSVDKRPLPAAWAQHGGAPKGAVACAIGSPDARRFSFELGAGPAEAAKAWRAHLSANGWTVADVADDDGSVFTATQAGTELRVFTSSHVEHLGWTTVTVKTAP